MRVLFVEDTPDAADAVLRPAEPVPGLVLQAAATPREAVARLRDADPPFHAAVVPVRLPGRSGLALLRWIRRSAPDTAAVAVVGSGDRETVLAVLGAGAHDYLVGGARDPDRLAAAVGNAWRRRQAEAERRARTLRVLYAGGSAEDVRRLRRHLARRAPHLRFTFAPGASEGEAWDVVLLDDRSSDAYALERLRDPPETPVVVVLAPGEEETALQAVRLGAAGYVLRNPGWLHQVPVEVECAFTRCELRRRLLAEHQREHLLQLVFDSLSTRVVVLDRAGRVTYASRSWLEMADACGTPVCSAVPGQSYLEACHCAAGEDADAARALEGITAVLEGRADRFEMEYPCHAGDDQWFLLQATPMSAGQGAVICHVNVTERHRMEKALRESHERYALATAAGAVGLWDWDLESGEMFVDPALKGLLGYADDEIPNHIDGWGSHVHPDDVREVMEEATAHLEGRTPRFSVEHRMLHRDGSIRWFLARGAAERRPDGTAYRLLGTGTDVTDRHQVEEALRASREELSRLAGRLMVAQEEERRRIARELHDDLSQRVAVLGMGIGQLAGASRETRAQAAQQLYTQLDRLAERIRGLSHRMHPALLEHAGLVPALGSICEEFGRLEGVHTTFQAERVEGPFPRDVALAVYRVAQEGLRNVARHSGAQRAQVTLTREGGSLDLVVADPGVGFDRAAVGPEGLGLVSMAERVNLLGGDFDVVTAPGEGTELRARFPLPQTEEEGDPDPAGARAFVDAVAD